MGARMRVLVNRNIRKLFVRMGLCMAVIVMVSAMPALWWVGAAASRQNELTAGDMTLMSEILALSVPLCTIIMGGAALTFCYRYFRQQDRQMNEAVLQIRAFISGDKDARIVCDEEGELYRFSQEKHRLYFSGV